MPYYNTLDYLTDKRRAYRGTLPVLLLASRDEMSGTKSGQMPSFENAIF